MNALNQQVSEALNDQRPALAVQMVGREFLRHPELEQRYGKIGREKCLKDAGYHLAYLAEAIAAGNAALFRDYIGWAKVVLAKRRVPVSDLAGLLVTMKETLREMLAPELRELPCEYLDAGLQQLPELPGDIPTFIVEGSPDATLAGEYLQALLRGDRRVAHQLILDAAHQGKAVRDLYLNVFQRTQYEIGRLWQVNEISVAQEHYCTAATQLIMAQLYPYIFGSEKKGGTLVATCVSGDLHEIGARMLADFFEMEGWDTHFLGANVPTPSVVQILIERRATLLGISATITYHLRAVEELIAAVRRAPACREVKIIVGGYPFKIAPELWRSVGADGFAEDASQAVALANRLTNLSLAA